ncbi:MAG TPA: 50S ribosomal protein L9 [Candidatus Borkfalkia avicola]|uniref:Large ribosomal subunit protein bL9 n=1 Tax=Candidatus Borkfalkia avicola TaxID=2838503 RepID=A0A9D2D873_9FIRM|nr:50S ribosomal protein L9 [Candidatus Borkfalkia avicola]
MKVILKQDVKGTGKKGDILDVSDGFAKNFLLKKGLAEQASSVAVNSLKIQKEAEARRRAEEIAAIRELAKKMDKAQVQVAIKCGENGKVFGSVTSKEIAARLAELGYDVDKKKILLKDPIKTVGDYAVEVRLMEGVTAKIFVSVVPAE